jgi:cytoskeletal protein CcmA (bactofilin family)
MTYDPATEVFTVSNANGEGLKVQKLDDGVVSNLGGGPALVQTVTTTGDEVISAHIYSGDNAGDMGIRPTTAFFGVGNGATGRGSRIDFTDLGSALSTTVITIDGSAQVTVGADGLHLIAGTDVNEFSTDGFMAGNSDDAVPTEQAVVEYVTAVSGALNTKITNKTYIGLSDTDTTHYVAYNMFYTNAGASGIADTNLVTFDGNTFTVTVDPTSDVNDAFRVYDPYNDLDVIFYGEDGAGATALALEAGTVNVKGDSSLTLNGGYTSLFSMIDGSIRMIMDNGSLGIVGLTLSGVAHGDGLYEDAFMYLKEGVGVNQIVNVIPGEGAEDEWDRTLPTVRAFMDYINAGGDFGKIGKFTKLADAPDYYSNTHLVFSTSSDIQYATGLSYTGSGLVVSGTLNATQAVTFDSTLDVDAGTTLNSTLDVDGATTLNNTLDVDGATTLNSSIDVDGAAVLHSTLTVTSGVSFDSTLDVDGATTLNSTLDVDAATTLNSSLDVDGTTLLHSTLEVVQGAQFNNNVVASGTATIYGSTTINNTINVTGAADFDNTLNVDGATTLNSTLKVVSDATVGGNITVSGTFQFDASGNPVNEITTTMPVDGDYSDSKLVTEQAIFEFVNAVSGTLSAQTSAQTFIALTDTDTTSYTAGNMFYTNAGATGIMDTAALKFDGTNFKVTAPSDFTNNVAISGTLNVDGTVDFDGAAYLNSTLDVDGAVTLNSTLDVDYATTLNNTLDVDGATTLNSTLDVDYATTLNSTLDVDGETTLNSSLDVDGTTLLHSTLEVVSAAYFNNNVTVSGSFRFDSDGQTVNAIQTSMAPTGSDSNLLTEKAIYDWVNTVSGSLQDDVIWEVVDTPYNMIRPKGTHMGKAIYSSGDLTIGGNLTVSGTTTTINTNELTVEDKLITLNNGETGAGITGDPLAGIEIERGSMANYLFVFDEQADNFRVGVSGTMTPGNTFNLQAVCTREDSPIDMRVPWWDADDYIYRNTGETYISVNSGTNTVSVVADTDTKMAVAVDNVKIYGDANDYIEINSHTSPLFQIVLDGNTELDVQAGGMALDEGERVNEITASIAQPGSDNKLATEQAIVEYVTAVSGVLQNNINSFDTFIELTDTPDNYINTKLVYSTGSDIQYALNLSYDGSGLVVSGTLGATGAVDFKSTINVDGGASFNSTVDVDGATTLNSTLDVDGATTLNSSVTVSGAGDFKTTVNVDGATTLNSTLDVDQATTLNSTLDVDGGTTLNSTLDVDGTTLLHSTLETVGVATFDNNVIVSGTTTIYGATTINDTLHVTEGADFDSTVNVDGAATFNNNFEVFGNSYFNNATVSGNFSFDTGATVNVIETAMGAPGDNTTLLTEAAIYNWVNTVSGVLAQTTSSQTFISLTDTPDNYQNTKLVFSTGSDIQYASNLSYTGSGLVVSGTLNATGAVDFDSTLNVDAGADFQSTIDVDGAATLNNTLDVDGATTLNNTLDVDGATTLNSTLDVDYATTLNSTLDVDGATTLNSSLDVDGTSLFHSTVDVVGAATFENNVTVSGSFQFDSTGQAINEISTAMTPTGSDSKLLTEKAVYNWVNSVSGTLNNTINTVSGSLHAEIVLTSGTLQSEINALNAITFYDVNMTYVSPTQWTYGTGLTTTPELQVYVNGLKQRASSDYYTSAVVSGVLTVNFAFTTYSEDWVNATYRK